MERRNVLRFKSSLKLNKSEVSTPYLIKIKVQDKQAKGRAAGIIYAIISLIFSFYALSTSGIAGILQLFILYAIGLIMIIIVAAEQKKKLFEKKWEGWLCVVITILGIIGVIYTVMSIVK